MPEFGNFALHFPDGSQFVFRNAYALKEEVTVVSLTIRVVTRDYGDFKFTLRGGDVVIEGEIHSRP